MIYYLLIINIITFIIYGIDKYKSIKHKYRISENSLIILAILGGSLGAFFGMIIFHHKTKKKKFIILIPIILLLWVYILVSF
ncbi:MAG: DUF1294 domain-containing protein [Bacilli bacterium]